MTSTNSTRTEVADRAAMLEVPHYDISLDLTAAPVGAPHNASTFISKITISLMTKRAGSTFIDLRDVVVKSVTIDGVDATEVARHASEIGINLDLTEGDHTVVIDADCHYTNNGQGVHRFQDPADGGTYLYSQFETANAKRMFIYFDQSDSKTAYPTHAVVLKGWKVISNSAVKIGATTDAHGNAADTFDFSVDVPLSTCLVTICAGPWCKVTDSWTGTVAPHPEIPAEHQSDGELITPLGACCRQSIAEHLDVDALFKETKEGFDFYAKHFGGPYPFGKYDQIFCPEYNMGAMEDAGCATIRDECVFRSKSTHYLYERCNDTILYGMAHMWLGDLVTIQWRDDLQFNEPFATWPAAVAQVKASDYSHAWTTFANVEKARAYKQDQLPSTHPITADASDIDTAEQNFDGITYAKGASTLKQLAAYVGQDVLPAGVRLHFSRHRFGNATFVDLLGALSEASGRDLSGWAGQWLTTTGITTLAPEFHQSADKYTPFAVAQNGAEPGVGQPHDYRTSVGIYNLRDTGADAVLERIKRAEINARDARTEVPELVDAPVGDVVLINDDDLTYSMIRLDGGSLVTVVDNIGALTDSMARTLCWSATWQMVRVGQMRARDFVNLVPRGIPGEDKLFVLERAVAQAASVVNVYADLQWVSFTGHDLLVQGLLDYAKKETDADHALVFVNALTTVGSSNSDVVDAPRAICAGDADRVGFPAVTVGTDTQWRALKALASAGLEGEEAIVKLEKTDNLVLGAQTAVVCRVPVPTLANKARVWAEAMVSGDDIPSSLVIRYLPASSNAPGSGEVFAQALDDDSHATIDAEQLATLLSEHFFATANSQWEQLSSETVQTLLEGFYPIWEISELAIVAAQRLFDNDETASPVKRTISEQQLLVKLALHAREFDAKQQLFRLTLWSSPFSWHQVDRLGAMTTSQTLFDSVGGEDVFNRIVHGFYIHMRSDDLIGPMYPSDDREGVEERLRMFLVQHWGGPYACSEQRGHPCLRMRHMPFSTGEAECDRWLEIMSASSADTSDEELPHPQREALWNHMVQAAGMLINRFDAQQELDLRLASSPATARQRTRV